MPRTKAAEEFDKSIRDADIILEIFDEISRPGGSFSPDKSDVLKRAGLIVAMAAWETYVKECVAEKVDEIASELSKWYSPAADTLKERLGKELKHFSNPNTERTCKLFEEFAGKKVTLQWKMTQTDLDAWIVLRGIAAHVAPKRGNPHPHLLDKKKLRRIIDGLKKLVDATEAALTS
jgi:hypothetical protein